MLTYLKGSATEPQGNGKKVIAHICNDIGGWGRGFVLSVTKKWPKAEADYRNWYQGNLPLETDAPPYPAFKLGSVRCVKVSNDTWVANMIAQHGIMQDANGIPPIRYDALRDCLRTLAMLGFDSIHMPRIGCGLAGGKWSEIEPIVLAELSDVDVFVYDYDVSGPAKIAWQP